jgi:hypothetical protein
VVASIIWVIAAGIMTWQMFGLKEPVFAPGWEIESVDGKPYMVIRAAERREALEKGAFVAITPPVAVLILGMSLIWVVRGFRS